MTDFAVRFLSDEREHDSMLDIAGPALLSWPTAFSTTIRASFVGTMTMEKYYDWNGNQEKIIILAYADPEYGVEGKFINLDNPALVNHIWRMAMYFGTETRMNAY